jgi:hypothetical protein
MNQIEAFRETLARCEDRWPVPMFGETSIEHMRDMLRRMETNSDATAPNGFSEAKLGRWLGYLQGVAVGLDAMTLEECKNINKKWAGDAPTQKWRPTHRHVKRGSSYRKIGTALLQSSGPIGEACSLVIYQAENGRLWARPEGEFDDGRFQELNAEASANG